MESKKKNLSIIGIIITIVGIIAIFCFVYAMGSNKQEYEVKLTDIHSENELEDSEKESASGNLLSFDFTPEEFYAKFLNIANDSNINVGELTSSSGSARVFFSISTAKGSSMQIFILPNPDGKVASIGLSYQNTGEDFLSIVDALIMSVDVNLDFDSLNTDLDFANPPSSNADLRTTAAGDIAFIFNHNRLSISRDENAQNEYNLTENSSPVIEPHTDDNPASEPHNNDSTTVPSSGNGTETSEPSGSNSPSTEPQSSDTPDNSPSENTGSETSGQKNALSKAHSYLNALPFSYSGLINQLEYEGFSTEEATYAADNCGANWTDQALKKAKNYLDTLPYSYSGLIEQLEYEGFTTSEATYGADNCGADWNEQAAKKAQSYLDVMAFSRDELISQLEYEGFTPEQAEYGVTAVGY